MTKLEMMKMQRYVERDDTDEHVGNDENRDGDDAVNAGDGDANGNDGHHKSGKEMEESDSSSYMDDSDELRSPSDSGDDSVVSPPPPGRDVTKRVQFDFTNINNPTLIKDNTFHNAFDFRKAVK
jgi:hypothetical protein